MAFVVTTDPATGIGQTAGTLHGHWTGADDDFGAGAHVDVKFLWGYGGVASNEAGADHYDTINGSHAFEIDELTVPPVTFDREITFDFRASDFFGGGGFVGGGELTFKTFAPAQVFGVPEVDAVRETEADVSVDYTPNTNESEGIVTVRHRLKDATTPWIGGSSSAALSGVAPIHVPITITGLLANTQYEFYFIAVRDTANDTTLGSAVGYFTTGTEGAWGGDVMWLG